MSRIGKRKINIPDGVEVNVEGRDAIIKGPKGELRLTSPFGVQISVSDSLITTIAQEGKQKLLSPLLGLTNSLLYNAVIGVKEGYSRKLELSGVGFRAKKTDNGISMSLGFSHPVEFQIPEGIFIDIEDNTKVTVSGIDKQLVGMVCAKIRKLKKPEPYKGKGIKYGGEVIRRKAGKAGKVQK